MSESRGPLAWVRRRVPLLRELPIEVTALSAIAFFVALGFGIVAPVIPMFAREFGVTAFAASAVVSVFAGMRLAAAPPATAWVRRFGERQVLIWGMLIIATSSLLAGLSQTYWQLITLRGLGGIGSTMYTVAAMSLLLRVVEPAARGRAASAWSGGFLAGGLAGPAVGGVFVLWSLRAPFFIYALTLTAAAVVSARGLRGAHLAAAEAVAAEPAQASFWQGMRRPAYRATVSANFSNGFVRFGLLNALVPLFVLEALDAPAGLASIAFLTSTVGQAVLLSRAGRMTDFWGRRPVLLLGAATGALGLLLLGTTRQPAMLIAAMFILGLGGALLSTAPAAVLGDVTEGRRQGQLVAGYQMSADFGAILGPLAGGWLLDAGDGFTLPFLAAAGLMVAVVMVAYPMPETRPDRATADGIVATEFGEEASA